MNVDDDFGYNRMCRCQKCRDHFARELKPIATKKSPRRRRVIPKLALPNEIEVTMLRRLRGGIGEWPANIAMVTGIPVSTVRAALRRLESRGLVSSSRHLLRMYRVEKSGDLLISAIYDAENLWGKAKHE